MELSVARLSSRKSRAETVSRALTCMADRLIWPYCLQLMAVKCLELHEEIGGAHEAHVRYAKRSGANLILSGLYDRLARLLRGSLLVSEAISPENVSATTESSRSEAGS